MYWIEVPSYAVAEEVRARLETDPRAVELNRPVGGTSSVWTLTATAFLIGFAAGWLWRL